MKWEFKSSFERGDFPLNNVVPFHAKTTKKIIILQCVRLRFRVLQNTGVQTKWGLACIGAVSLKMNHSSYNDDFWLSLEGYARAYYRVLHAIYGLPRIVGGKKFTLHANKTLQPRFFHCLPGQNQALQCGRFLQMQAESEYHLYNECK